MYIIDLFKLLSGRNFKIELITLIFLNLTESASVNTA